MKNKLGVIVTSTALLGSLAMAGSAFAATAPTTGAPTGMGHGMPARPPGVFGTVSAINGTTLTLTSKMFARPASGSTAAPTPTSITYTVDASGATVTKAGVASTLATIAVGDMLSVQGTLSGTSVTATAVRDGVPPGGMMGGRGGMGMQGKSASSTPAVIQGNGEPVVGGNVTAITGSTLTVTNKSNVTYSVDASAATIETAGKLSTLSTITLGDAVVVQGTVNGTSIVASSVMNQGMPKTSAEKGSMVGGVMGAIGGFFHNLFGFF